VAEPIHPGKLTTLKGRWVRLLLASPLTLMCFACKPDKPTSRSEIGPTIAGGSLSSGAVTPVPGIEVDSVSQSTARGLEQLLFSQDAPSDFPQDYWALGRRIYDDRHYSPLWIGTDITSASRQIRLALLCRATDEGIALPLPATGTPPTPLVPALVGGSLARRDLHLTFALVQYLATLARGAVDPLAAGVDWHATPPRVASDSTLAAAVESPDSATIARLTPASPQYAALARKLTLLLNVQSHGGWEALADSTLLHPGSRGPGVRRLRQRLVISRDLPPADSLGLAYTAAVARGVRNFQRRMGLTPDGRVGPAPRGALDVATDARALTVAENLERYRWIPRSPEGEAVIIDVAAGSAQLWRDGMPVLNTRIRANSNCRERIPPIIADTIAVVASKAGVINVHLLSGDSLIIRGADARGGAAACLISDDIAALRRAIGIPKPSRAPATELYLIWPTAYVAPDSALTYRRDLTGADARLGAKLPAMSANSSPICDSLPASHDGVTTRR
jgi:murein L,D-transpeptidase YcbB/YkuD